MATTVSRITSSGTFYVNSNFDEVTYNPTTLTKNLLQYSQQFDNSIWTKPSATITADATTAPDGTLTADKLIANNGVSLTANDSTGAVYQQPAIVGTTTFSVYAKAAEITTIRIRERAESGCRIIVDLTTGQISYETGNAGQVSATATLISNGWYRIACTRTPTTSSNYDIKQGGLTGDGSSGIYIWGAQFEVGTQATFYVATPVTTLSTGTTTRTDPTGIYYTSGGIDEVSYNTSVISKNLLKYSQDYSTSTYWSNTLYDVTLTPTTATTAPNGTLTATKLVSGTTTVYHATRQDITGVTTIGMTYTFSVYAKAAEWSLLHLQVYDSASYGSYFDLSAGTVSGAPSGVTTSIASAGNGWYYCSITRTAVGLFNSVYIIGNQTTGGLYAGDNTSGIYIWGSQFEALSTPTFYVKTTLPVLDKGFSKRDDSSGTTFVSGGFDEYSWKPLPVTSGQILNLDLANPTSYNGDTGFTDLSGAGVLPTIIQRSPGGGVYSYDSTSYNGTSVLALNNTTSSQNAQIAFANLPNMDNLVQSYNFTVMFAAKKNYYGLGGNNNGNTMLFSGSGNGYNTGWRINENRQGTTGTAVASNSPHNWTLGLNDISATNAISVTDPVASNRMTIVAMTLSPTTMSIFCNGATASKAAPAFYTSGTGGTVVINGAGAGGEGSFNGHLGFFTIYNRALTDAEVTQNYNAVCGRYGLPRI